MIKPILRNAARTAILLSVFGGEAARCGQLSYSITQLDSLIPGAYSQAYAINLSGQIAGESNGSAVFWDPVNGITALPALNPSLVTGSSAAYSINNQGQLAGWSTATQTPGPSGITQNNQHAVLWNVNGNVTDLGTLGQVQPPSIARSIGLGLNDAGQVVGNSSFQFTTFGASFPTTRGFVWDSTNGMQNLGDLESGNTRGIFSGATAINSSGVIVGSANFNNSRAVVSDPSLGWQSLLNDLSQTQGYSAANAIDNNGVVVGVRSATATFGGSGFITSTVPLVGLGNVVDLQPLTGGDFSTPMALNNYDPNDPNAILDVVGDSSLASGETIATLWQFDANNNFASSGPLGISPTGYINTVATGVNDLGQIVGYGTNVDDGQVHAFLLTPVPPGASQSNPVQPNQVVGNTWDFANVASGLWFDPATAFGYDFSMDSNSVFTEILGFPTGFSDPFSVYSDGEFLGSFGPGDTFTFADGGVTSFSIRDINPMTDPNDPGAFPLQLAFDTPTASFSMTAVSNTDSGAPEPGGFLLLGMGLAGIAAARRYSAKRRRNESA